MARSVLISRLSDNLPLYSSMDDENSEPLNRTKNTIRSLLATLDRSPSSQNSKCSIQSPPFLIHYSIAHGGVICLLVCDPDYPRKLAFSFLDDLIGAFMQLCGSEIYVTGLRPFSFARFDSTMISIRQRYQNPRTEENLARLQGDLQDVQRIMTKNVEELLWRGDSLDRMTNLSDQLRGETLKYKNTARRMNMRALYQKYGPPVVVLGVVLLVLWVRWTFF